MRQITKKYTIYNYDDIINNSDLKEKILKKHYDINVDFDWYSYILEYWQEKLEEIGFIKPEINFSGFWSQGDGASFTCDYIDIKKIAQFSGLFTSREINVLYALYNQGYIEGAVKRITHHYYHEYTVKNEFYDGNMLTSWKHLQKVVDKLKNYINDSLILLSQSIYNELQNEYNYQTSEPAILETLRINEYEFYSDGSIAA